MVSLRSAGSWVKDAVPAPGEASGATVGLYYSYGKTARQRRIEYAWRRFTAIITKHSELQSDTQYDLRFDPRDGIVASCWREVCRLRVAEKEQIAILWKEGQLVFTLEQTKVIGDAFADALAAGWG